MKMTISINDPIDPIAIQARYCFSVKADQVCIDFDVHRTGIEKARQQERRKRRIPVRDAQRIRWEDLFLLSLSNIDLLMSSS